MTIFMPRAAAEASRRVIGGRLEFGFFSCYSEDEQIERRSKMSRKILVPLDGSPASEAVLPHAVSLARSEGAEVVVLRVPLVPAREFFGRDAALEAKVRAEIDEEARRYVKAKVRRLEKQDLKATGLIREGTVPDTIVRVADEIHADMIAMSTHGRTGWQRWLHGSVAGEIVHLTHIPVVLIHPN
jgi:nucleotide-binding universal stress UspA family protein